MNLDNSSIKKAAFFDIDGTLTSAHAWKGFLEYFQIRGLRRWTHFFYSGTHYPLFFLRKLGLISVSSFRTPWAANMAWYLRGLTPDETNEIWDYVVSDFLKENWREDSISILKQHLDDGDIVMLVSSGPSPLVERTRQELGVHYGVGTELEIKNGRYSGRSLKPICIETYKASLSKKYLLNLGIDNLGSTTPINPINIVAGLSVAQNN